MDEENSPLNKVLTIILGLLTIKDTTIALPAIPTIIATTYRQLPTS